MLKIDIHTHILPREIPSWKDKFGYGGFIMLDHYRPCCARMLRDDGVAFRDALIHLVLPAFALAISVVAPVARITRTSMLATLRQDYVRTARAKGLPQHLVILRKSTAIRRGPFWKLEFALQCSRLHVENLAFFQLAYEGNERRLVSHRDPIR